MLKQEHEPTTNFETRTENLPTEEREQAIINLNDKMGDIEEEIGQLVAGIEGRHPEAGANFLKLDPDLVDLEQSLILLHQEKAKLLSERADEAEEQLNDAKQILKNAQEKFDQTHAKGDKTKLDEAHEDYVLAEANLTQVETALHDSVTFAEQLQNTPELIKNQLNTEAQLGKTALQSVFDETESAPKQESA